MAKPYNAKRLEWHLDVESTETPQSIAWSCQAAGVTFGRFNRLAVALAKSQDHRVLFGVFAFGTDRQGALANGPMSGLHPYTDGISFAPPMPVAFRSDHENEQHKPTSASGPRYGCSIKRIRRSASSSPLGWLKTPKPPRSGVSGAHYDQVDLTSPSDYDSGQKGNGHG